MVVAVASEDPDVRRDAVAEVAKSDAYNQDWAIKGFLAIALLESDTQARCVAIRALAKTHDPRATEAALKIIHFRDYPPEEVWPPDELCRWDATVALADLSAADAVPEMQRERTFETLIERLAVDPNRHVRIAAARALGEYARPQAVEALIGGLRDDDFAVVYQCEDSLVRLTGHTHSADVTAWQAWYADHRDDLFAMRGHIPESRRLPYDNRFEKAGYEMKQFFRLLVPESKE